MTQRTFRGLMNRALDEYLPLVSDALSYEIRTRNNLLNLAKSLRAIHFPGNEDERQQAYERLSFEEFLLFQIPLVLRKLRKRESKGIAHQVTGELVPAFLSSLPFMLTPDQKKVLEEISSDMARPQAMQRLLQGDVGSGKTVVATAAALIAVQGGYQAAFMAPTEILARQHYEKIKSQIAGCKPRGKEIRIGMLAGSAEKKHKEKIYQEVKDGAIDLVIGTHALLQESVQFKSLGLVIIDEQHKFGVGQRALLPQKGIHPDVLIMTATPIPRTLAITLYGDLDDSVIRQLPPGRQPIVTIHCTQERRAEGYRRARQEIMRGRQVYIVYPVIEDSYALDIAGAEKMYEHLKNNELKGVAVGLMHGKMKQQEQNDAMLKFKNGELSCLVATTVLEVGIDVPNATCMIIEYAERFGLSQLHQLRGRVGRGPDASVCVLISDPSTDEAVARMEAMVRYSDGFRIAEEDLKIRGPGEFFGARQHGLTELKIGNPLKQLQLLKKAREEALRLVTDDPRLQDHSNLLLKEKLLRQFPEYEKLMMVA